MSLRGRMAMSVLLLALTGALAGCPSMPPTPAQPQAPRPAQMPSYSQVALSYNRNVVLIDRLWAKAFVRVQYRDEKNRLQQEQGEDSTLMVEVPDRLSLMVGKLGNIFLHVGCDNQRYWLIELLGKHSAVYGRNALLDHAPLSLPIRVRPSDLPLLMGLVPIPTGEGLTPAPPVDWRDGCYALMPPGLRARVLIQPDTFLPYRVELLDSKGEPAVVAWHSKPQPMAMALGPTHERPQISSRIDIRILSDGTRLQMDLSRMTDARGEEESRQDRAFRRAFDLPYLLRAHRVEPEDVVDLDVMIPPTVN